MNRFTVMHNPATGASERYEEVLGADYLWPGWSSVIAHEETGRTTVVVDEVIGAPLTDEQAMTLAKDTPRGPDD